MRRTAILLTTALLLAPLGFAGHGEIPSTHDNIYYLRAGADALSLNGSLSSNPPDGDVPDVRLVREKNATLEEAFNSGNLTERVLFFLDEDHRADAWAGDATLKAFLDKEQSTLVDGNIVATLFVIWGGKLTPVAEDQVSLTMDDEEVISLVEETPLPDPPSTEPPSPDDFDGADDPDYQDAIGAWVNDHMYADYLSHFEDDDAPAGTQQLVFSFEDVSRSLTSDMIIGVEFHLEPDRFDTTAGSHVSLLYGSQDMHSELWLPWADPDAECEEDPASCAPEVQTETKTVSNTLTVTETQTNNVENQNDNQNGQNGDQNSQNGDPQIVYVKEDKDTPGPAVALVGLALLGAVLVIRRRL